MRVSSVSGRHQDPDDRNESGFGDAGASAAEAKAEGPKAEKLQVSRKHMAAFVQHAFKHATLGSTASLRAFLG
jgi:hypothetical protein